jgi:two-component system, LytTR family, sensor kinase
MASTVHDRAIKERPYWLVIAVIPFIPALLSAVRSYLQSRIQHGRADWNEVAFTFFNWLLLGVVTPLIYVLARRYPIRKKEIGRAIGGHLLGGIAFGLIWAAIGVLLGWLLGRFPGEGAIWRGYVAWLVSTFPYSMLLYLLMLGCVYAFTYYDEARQRESQQARLAAQLAQARLGALRMQLNPHFLFNSLNAITVLVRDNNNHGASEMLELLSDVLRHVLQNKKEPEVTLHEETTFIEKYLAIEQVRFSDRLKIRFSIEPTLRDVLVPELILQPLVENAIRHGIAQRIEDGEMEIAARENEGNLLLSVQDNGPGYQACGRTGVGLANTRARLEELYGAAGLLHVSTGKDGGTVAVLSFPLKRKSDE